MSRQFYPSVIRSARLRFVRLSFRSQLLNLVSAPYSTGITVLVGVEFQFDLQIRNVSNRSVSLPFSQRGGTDPGFSLVGVDFKVPEGSWKSIQSGDWIGSPKDVYGACRTLSPGQSIEIKSVFIKMPFFKSKLNEVGKEPTLRFTLWLLCRQPDGTKPIETLVTEPFVARIPSQ